MKVILNDHVEHLGERGQVVNVKPGYGRNYLIPKGLAYPHTPGYRKLYEQEQGQWEEMDLKRRSAAEQVAGELDGTELHFERRAGERDSLFGSVSVVDIARELADRGFEIDKRRIVLAEPIKTLGKFEVEVRVHHDITVTLPIEVTRLGGERDHELEGDEKAATDESPAEGEVTDNAEGALPEPAQREPGEP